MTVSDLHRQVAAIALAAAGHGFALGGGNALLAHGLTVRPRLTLTNSPTRNTALKLRPLRSRRPADLSRLAGRP